MFGHTHNAEVVELDSGTFVHSGNWLRSRNDVGIDDGSVPLREWDPITKAPVGPALTRKAG